MDQTDIEFSVVSGSSEEMLFGCLESLHMDLSGSALTWSVSVTCNTPGSGLAGRLRRRYPLVRIIENAASRGFAANHNSVLSVSRARYVWLLNDDLLILPGAIQGVTAFMNRPENSRVAAASPKLLNPDGSLQPSTYGFPSMPQILLANSGLRELRASDALLRRVAPLLRSREGSSRFWAHDKTVEVDTLRGACVAMRMKAVRQVGLMVEVAIVGGEEPEWHRRFHENGWKIVYFPEASVIHYGSQTVRDGSNNFHHEYLKGALYFFRTGRPDVKYRLFCISLLAMFGVKAAIGWVTRDRTDIAMARRSARVAWDGLMEGRS